MKSQLPYVIARLAVISMKCENDANTYRKLLSSTDDTARRQDYFNTLRMYVRYQRTAHVLLSNACNLFGLELPL